MSGETLLIWVVRGPVGVCVAGVAGIFFRVRTNEKALVRLETRMEHLPAGDGGALAAKVDTLERALADLRLHVAEHYISREDWVPTASRVLGVLEEHTAMLAPPGGEETMTEPTR